MKVISIFKSVNGEICAEHQGSIAAFLRLWGCNFNTLGLGVGKCTYCDTPKCRDDRYCIDMTYKEVLDKILSFNTRNVTITGGEILLQQDDVLKLTNSLSERGKKVSIETNGSIKVPFFPSSPTQYLYPSWVVDWKLPSSGMSDQMRFKNFENVGCFDFVKFVVGDRNDFDAALIVMKELKKSIVSNFAFSPVMPKLNPKTLVNWMLEEELCNDTIFNLQIHKIINVQ